MADTCHPEHDFYTALLSFGLCFGLILSYLPQHFRIINKGTSEGISPWFLLLGCTSAAAGMLNLFTMQWGIIKCCHYISSLACIELTAGEFQVGLQWLMFNLILVLYMIYYPRHLKYELDTNGSPHNGSTEFLQAKTPKKSVDWKFSILVSWLTFIHLLVIFITTTVLLKRNPVPASSNPKEKLPSEITKWALFLGVSSATLAAIQYMPQLIRTYRLKLVGALSIPMMCIQTPGAILMVLNIALRPSTNWTSWITFAVAGIMQGFLLFMCILWKIRQHKLGIDDFGHPLSQRPAFVPTVSEFEEVPVLTVRSGGVQEVPEIMLDGEPLQEPSENTPLLGGDKTARSGWRRWF
ncbi:hypothetical protein DL96DRAFT_1694322 [Flagelloscypha sp. PMI_526]|nr:hypothetical protein DL96DRAFT_1694322 [Flagelloscypha sp. PMI_526]